MIDLKKISGIKKGHRIYKHILPVIILLSVFPVHLSCILDSEPALPAFPTVVDVSIPFEDIGIPSICICTNTQDLALIAADQNLAVLDIVNCEVVAVLNIGVEIKDLGDSDVSGYEYVLTDSMLYPVDLTGHQLENPINVGAGSEYLSVSNINNVAWIVHDDDSLTMVDLLSLAVKDVSYLPFSECQGIVASPDGNAIFLADGSRDVIVAFDTETGTEIGCCSVPGDVIDLFPGPQGFVCAIVEGSNELWFIRSDNCSLYRMITFPVTPVAAASMPNGCYAYASCTAIGLIIVSESGQPEFKSMEFGIPVSIDIDSKGYRAVICSPDNEAVYILKR